VKKKGAISFQEMDTITSVKMNWEGSPPSDASWELFDLGSYLIPLEHFDNGLNEDDSQDMWSSSGSTSASALGSCAMISGSLMDSISPVSSPQPFSSSPEPFPSSPEHVPNSSPQHFPSSPEPSSSNDNLFNQEKGEALNRKYPWAKLNGKDAYDVMIAYYKNVKTKSYNCPYPHCNKNYKSKTDIKDHINRHHILFAAFQCLHCSEHLKAQKELNRHIKLKHPNNQVNGKAKNQIHFVQAVIDPTEGHRKTIIDFNLTKGNNLVDSLIARFSNNSISFDLPTHYVSNNLVKIVFDPPFNAPWEENKDTPVPYLDFHLVMVADFAHDDLVFRWVNQGVVAYRNVTGFLPFLQDSYSNFTDQKLQTCIYQNRPVMNSEKN
jgi:hypothetical protein